MNKKKTDEKPKKDTKRERRDPRDAKRRAAVDRLTGRQKHAKLARMLRKPEKKQG